MTAIDVLKFLERFDQLPDDAIVPEKVTRHYSRFGMDAAASSAASPHPALPESFWQSCWRHPRLRAGNARFHLNTRSLPGIRRAPGGLVGGNYERPGTKLFGGAVPERINNKFEGLGAGRRRHGESQCTFQIIDLGSPRNPASALVPIAAGAGSPSAWKGARNVSAHQHAERSATDTKRPPAR